LSNFKAEISGNTHEILTLIIIHNGNLLLLICDWSRWVHCVGIPGNKINPQGHSELSGRGWMRVLDKRLRLSPPAQDHSGNTQSKDHIKSINQPKH
jgi:hypothetical protein